jgi:splicing factor 1
VQKANPAAIVARTGTRKRKKGNRWGDEGTNSVAGLVGLPTAILTSMTSEQLDAYAAHLRIEEITQKLKINDIIPRIRYIVNSTIF